MDKKRIKRALLARKFYNSTERIAQAVLYVKRPKEILIDKNAKYGDDKMERLDFIYTLSNTEKTPMVIYIHGGGWLSGIKDMRRYYCYEWAKNGFFVANIDYSNAPDRQFPHQFQQLFNAIDFILDNKDGHNFNPDKIILAGESAGGYHITMLAVLLRNRQLFDSLHLTFRHYDSFYPKALVNICGAIDLVNLKATRFPGVGIMIEAFVGHNSSYLLDHSDDEAIKNMSPINFITESFPPTMIISASKDPLRVESYKLEEILMAKGVDYGTYEGTGIISSHAWPIAVKLRKGRESFNISLNFVKPYMR